MEINSDFTVDAFKLKLKFRLDKRKKPNYPKARKHWNLARELREAFFLEC